MRFVWSCALKDLRRQLSDPFAMALWLGIPIILGGLIVLAFGGSDTVPKAHVLVANEDGSLPSTLFVKAFQNMPVVTSEQTNRTAGRERVDNGHATALLIIPRGFGASVLAGDSVTLSLITNPAQHILPLIAGESVGILADATFYVERLLRPALADLPPEVLAGSALPSNEVVSRVSVHVNESIAMLQPYVVPPVVSLVTSETAGPQEHPGGVGALFFPGILLMSLLFASQGMSADLWEEVQSGTLRRTAATPRGVVALLGGKLLAGTILMTAVCAVAVAVGVRFFAVPLARLPLAVAWGALAGAAFLSGLFFVQTLASVRRAANMLVTFLLFPLLMVGGSFFPLESLPSWLAAVGRWTPNGMAVVELQSILRGETDVSRLAFRGLAFAAATVVLFALAAARTQRRFVRG